MKPYLLPLFERSISITEENHGRGYSGLWTPYCDCLHIDEVGVFIHHDGKQSLTTDLIRHYIGMRRRTECVVDAESVGDAIHRFYNEWEGAKIGGEHEEAKALWIDRVDSDGRPSHKLIVELPECVQMHVNDRGGITCGRPIYSIPDHPEKNDESMHFNGEFGMCGLDGYDFPETDTCPMHRWFGYRGDPLPIRTVTVDGKEYHYISAKDLLDGERLTEEKRIAEERSRQIQQSNIYQRLRQVTL
jgi:hypothetical protein